MRDTDLDAIEQAVQQRDAQGLAAASAEVGLALSLELLTQLSSGISGTMKLRDVLRAMDAAMTDPAGIVVVEKQHARFGTDWDPWHPKAVCLAVRHDRAVTVGVKKLKNIPMSVGDAWPGLRPWFKVLEKNRARLETWCADTTAGDRVRVPLTARPERHEKPNVVDEAALIAAIVENPDDLDARLVLADHLLEREDPRGEMIRVDLQLRALADDDPQRKSLAAAVEKLVAAHGARLAGDVAQIAAEYTMAGGFVERVKMPAGTFKKYGDRLFREQPIRAYIPKPWNDGAVATLAKCPHLGRVRELTLESAGVGFERVVSIAPLAKGKFDRLESLHLSSTITTGPDAEQFFRELDAPRLRSLSVTAGFLGAGALRGIAANAQLCRSLETLKLAMLHAVLGATKLERDALAIADTVFARLELPKLRSLDVYDCWFASDERIGRLVKNSPALESFECHKAGLESLAAATYCKNLRELHMRVPVPVPTLSALLALPKLRRIWVSPEGWTDDEIEKAAKMMLALPASHPLVSVHFAGAYYQQLKRRFPVDARAALLEP